MGIVQMDAEVVETVAGVVRLLRREAELASHFRLGDAVMIIFVQTMARKFSLSLQSPRAWVLIIMTNSETKMILTPRWYTVAQVAQLLNYGESKVRMLIITGQLRSIKDGRSRRILPEWVEAYVQDRAKSTEDIW